MTDNECVNKQAILDAIKSTKPEPSEYMDMTDNIAVNVIILGAAVKQYEDIVKIVEAAQPIECKPVVHGHWVRNKKGYVPLHRCSICGEDADDDNNLTPYCPYCGAKMDESEV